MAAVKEIEKAIKSHQYVHDSIAYVLSPENRNGDEKCCLSTCINCNNNGADGLALQFRAVRFAFDKDDKILSHHYVQSFSPNEKITPELAHKIGVELAERVAPGFQIVVATHIDKDHLHTHFIINSVNYKTGMKWKGDLRQKSGRKLILVPKQMVAKSLSRIKLIPSSSASSNIPSHSSLVSCFTGCSSSVA